MKRPVLFSHYLFLMLWILLPLGGMIQAQEEEEDICEEAFIPEADAGYYVGLGNVQFDLASYARAVDIYTCAISLDENYAPAYARRGFAYGQLQDLNSALADFEIALSLDETLIEAYNNRGNLYTRNGNFGLAVADFSLATALAPEDPVAYHNRAVVHAIEDNYDLAMADLESVLSIAPDYAPAQASLAAIHSAIAVQHYQRFLEISGQNARLPAGTPVDVLLGLDEARRSGTYSVWLNLLVAAQR